MATIKDLKFDDKNFNKHTEFGMSLLEKSLRENGAGRSILLDKDNNIIAGNGIVEAAGQIGLENVKIVEATGDEIIAVKRTDVSLNSHKGREMALADNATAAVDLAWDDEAIKSEFTEEETKGWGVDLDWSDVEKEVEEDEAPEVNDSEPADSELGKVYQLGEHRLMCGDSTDAGSVAILMDGQKADMVFTDPPYELETEGGGIFSKVESIKAPQKQIKKNGVDTFDPNTLRLHAKTNVFFHNRPLIKKYIELAENNQKPYDLAIYKKGGIPNYNGHLMTDIEYIAIIGEQNPNAGLSYETYSKVFEGHKDPENELSYSKPVAICCKFIKLYSKNTVLDLFGGSGSTLIACEQLGRKCYMMELDPKYCDVIRKRYWKFKTGSEEGWQDGTKAIL
jgi:DNA modification methylase